MSEEKKKFPDRNDARAGKWLRRIGSVAAVALAVVVVVVTGKRLRL